jgi:peroxin-3
MSSLAKSVWEFIKYHKKKFIALLLTCALGVGGFFFMKRALLAKLAEVGEIGKMLEQKRRKEMELQRLRGECTSTITTFLSPLRRQLNKLTDVIPITTQLKELRAKQKARKALSGGKKTEEDVEDEKHLERLWEDLKVYSLARLITSVYALTLMDLLLRVQLHVAAKKALEDREKGSEAKVTQKVREQFMFKATDFFVSQGLNTLLQRVEKGIRAATKPWMMGTDAEVTRTEIVDMVKNIRREIENSRAGDDSTLSQSAHAWFLSCLIQPDEALARAKEDAGLDAAQAGELKAMLDETMDLLESPHFAAVLEEALNTLFTALLDDLHARQFEGKKDVTASPRTSPSPPPSVAPPASPRERKYILAKVIVGIKLFAKFVLATNEADADEGDDAVTTESNRYVHKLEALPALEELSRAILALTPDDDQGLEGLGEMKDLLPLLASMGGGGANGTPDLSSLLPLLGGAGAGGVTGAGPMDRNNLMAMLQQQQQPQLLQDAGK